MLNFVLPAKEKLPGNYRNNWLYFITGKELHTEWETKFKNNAGAPATK